MRSKNGRTTKDGIRIYEQADFVGMHAAGALAAKILDDIAAHVFVGQTAGEIDRIITQMVTRRVPEDLPHQTSGVILVAWLPCSKQRQCQRLA